VFIQYFLISALICLNCIADDVRFVGNPLDVRLVRGSSGIRQGSCFEKGAAGPEALTLAIRRE